MLFLEQRQTTIMFGEDKWLYQRTNDGHRGRKWSERGWVFKGEEGTKKKDFLRDKFGKREKQKR